MDKMLRSGAMAFVGIAGVLLIGAGQALSVQPESSRFPEFLLEKKYESQGDSLVWIYRKEGATIRLKVIDKVTAQEARDLIDTADLTMQSLYDSAASAYPGMISQEIVCDQKFVPTRKSEQRGDMQIIYYVAYLSSRLYYGACTEDLTPYRGVLAWAYCQNKEQFEQMEYIVAKNDFDSAVTDYVMTHICQ
jgi:hypothetical protein